MAFMLLVETGSDRDGGDQSAFLDLALELAASGNDVNLWLLQNGALHLRQRNHALWGRLGTTPHLTVFADAFSLEHRGLAGGDDPAVRIADMDELVNQLMDTVSKPIWH